MHTSGRIGRRGLHCEFETTIVVNLMILDKVMNKETVSEIGIITKVKFNRHIGLAPIFRE
jgi:hypothetical protein